MYDALTGTNTGTYDQYVAQNGYMPRSTYEGTRALRGDQIPWQDQLRNSMIIPASTDVPTPVAAPEISMIGRYAPTPYTPVTNQFPSLLSPTNAPSYSGNYGVNRYAGLLGPQLNFNAPTGTMPSYNTNTYQPTPSTEPNDIYKMGSLLSSMNNPIFSFIGNDMMSKTPTGSYTVNKS
jgi:hypothetical protein